MRLGDLTIGDVFYLVDGLDLGPLLRKDSTSCEDDASFVEAEYLNLRHSSTRFMYHNLKVIKVGRIEHDYT